MGHHSCCNQQKVKRGLWSPEEDEKLIRYISTHGYGCWSEVPDKAGLQRCGKSCRLRWINYLRPDIRRGRFTPEEEKLIISLHEVVGNRWAHIASHLPGRTDNEIKNYWNSWIKKKIRKHPSSSTAIVTTLSDTATTGAGTAQTTATSLASSCPFMIGFGSDLTSSIVQDGPTTRGGATMSSLQENSTSTTLIPSSFPLFMFDTNTIVGDTSNTNISTTFGSSSYDHNQQIWNCMPIFTNSTSTISTSVLDMTQNNNNNSNYMPSLIDSTENMVVPIEVQSSTSASTDQDQLGEQRTAMISTLCLPRHDDRDRDQDQDDQLVGINGWGMINEPQNYPNSFLFWDQVEGLTLNNNVCGDQDHHQIGPSSSSLISSFPSL